MRIFLLSLLSLLTSAVQADIYDLRCEGLRRPLGIDTTTPHFSWKHQLQRNGQQQTAYELQLGSDSLDVVRGRADLWRSGRVSSALQLMVPYEGKPLTERQLCYWRVRTWDERGHRSKWSGVERFSVGVLNGLQGQYIALRQDSVWAAVPMFRKTVTLSKQRKRLDPVFVHVNSLGYHELYINGMRVGDCVLQPAISQIDRHSLIVSYDVTSYLHAGDNEVLIWCGQGWNRKSRFGSRYEGALVKAEVSQLTDGLWQTLASTDDTWQAAVSGYSYTDVWLPLRFGGERLNGGAQLAWQQAEVVPVTGVRATPQLFEGNHIVETLQPQSVTEQSDGSLLVDFGRIVTGWLQAEFMPMERGQEAAIDYSDYIPLGGTFMSLGEKDFYVARGEGEERFTNKFHHHAFRYVRVSNARLKSVKALKISAVNSQDGATFVCSDVNLNAVHDLVRYTLGCLTFSGYMVDCPHLERMGYGGDGNASTMTLQTIFDVVPTFMNWLEAWADLMDEDGSLPHTAPAGRDGGGPYWCGFMVKAPWRTYLNYGDSRLLQRHYDEMKRWLQYVQKYSSDGLLERWPDTDHRTWFLGDWLAPKGVDVGGESVFHVSNCFVSECLGNMVDVATLLGHADDARFYAEWRQRLKTDIHRRFYHADTHTYANGTTLDQAYALLAGITPDEATRKAVENRLLDDAKGRFNSHIAVGLMGVPIFTEWATKARQSDLVATILRQPDYPGYLYMIANGATATWESWDSERSRVHNCYNGIGTWFYQALAGIRPDEHAPGYRHFYVDPQPTGGVSWVKATKPTPSGEIRVEIGADGRLSLVVPVGTTATVYPKSSREQTFGAGRWQIDPAL